MMASIIPWARFRKTYGAAIVSRELVERRLGRIAGLVTACDARGVPQVQKEAAE
mgnify:CR=1 FL=1